MRVGASRRLELPARSMRLQLRHRIQHVILERVDFDRSGSYSSNAKNESEVYVVVLFGIIFDL